MTWWVAGLLGLAAAGLGELLDLYLEIRGRGLPWRVPGSLQRDPTRPGPAIYLCAGLLRLVIGGGTAALLVAAEMIATPPLAVGAGFAAPLILERLAKLVPAPGDPAVDPAPGVPDVR